MQLESLKKVEAARRVLDTPASIATRLTERQQSALRKLGDEPGSYYTATELGTTGATLNSLNDFERGKRDILAPLMMVAFDHNTGTGQRIWHITDFGRKVLAELDALPIAA